MAANGAIDVEAEALIDAHSIFPASPLRIDLNQLTALAAKEENAYGNFLGQCLASADSVHDALSDLDKSGTVRVQLLLEGGAGLLDGIRWECLQFPGWGDCALSVNPSTPFSRFAAVRRTVESAIEDHVLRLLLVVASPENDAVEPIDACAECRSVIDACSRILDRNQMTITVLGGYRASGSEGLAQLRREGVTILDGPSTADRVAALLANGSAHEGPPHALHLIAHGTYRAATRQFFLLLESEAGLLQPKEGGALCRDWPLSNLRLLFLESCQSAVQSIPSGPPPDEFSAFKSNITGFMQLLVQAGLPGVVAMQDRIAVADARTFNQGFYSRLVEEGLADAAANNGRQLLYSRPGGAWSIPAFATRLKRGAMWAESPLRKAGRALYAKIQQAKQDRFFPDFPLDAAPVPADNLKSRSPVPSESGIAQVFTPSGVQADVQTLLAEQLKGTGGKTLCVLGETGRAKTSILETTYLREAQRHWQEEQPAIPVMLRLQDCVYSNLNPVTTFAAAVQKYFTLKTGFTPDLDYIAGRFEERSFLFLIIAEDDFQQGSVQDGLKMLSAFSASFENNGNRNPHTFIITLDQNLVTLADLPAGSDCLVLQPMSMERVGKYLRTLAPARGNGNQRTVNPGERLWHSLQENCLFDLAEVPWLLSEMLDQHRRGVGESSRADILKRIIDDRICQVSGSVGVRARVEEAIFRLAWDLQSKRERSMPGSDLFRTLSELRGNRDFSLFEFRDCLIRDCRILAPVGEDGVRFAFAGFRAYCCAQYIHRQPPGRKAQLLEEITAVLGRRSRADWWTETLIVYAGLERDTGSLLRMVLAGSLLNEGEPVFVAARCLQESRLAARLTAPNTVAPGGEPLSSAAERSVVAALIYRSHPLSYGSAAARQRALQHLGPLKEPDAMPHLVALALKKTRPGRDQACEFDFSGVRLAAIKAILYMPKDDVFEAISKDPEFEDHRELHSLIEHWLKLDEQALAGDLQASGPIVSSVAAFALSLMKPDNALDTLASRFRDAAASSDLLWALADSLLELGSPDLSRVIDECIADPERGQFAAYLIGKLGTTHSKPEYISFLHGQLKPDLPEDAPGDAGLRGRALRALAELQETGIRKLCHEWLLQRHSTLRHYALQSVRHIGDRESLAILERLQWNPQNTPLFEHLRLEVYEDLYWSLAGGRTREVMVPV